MAFPSRRTFSKEASDVHLSGVPASYEGLSMYGEYKIDSKLPADYPHLPALEYLDHFPALSADRPVGYPHLINMEKYKEEIQRQDLRVADAVVTVLYNWEPEALSAFLDDGLEDFRFQVEDSNVYPHNFYVQRKGNRVECGYVDYESHEYRIEESGEWTPLSVIVKIRRRLKENRNAHQKVIGDLHVPPLVTNKNYNLEEQATKKPADTNVKPGHLARTTEACRGTTIRIGFIDKVQQKAMIHDGTKLADDVLALPVWSAAPLIRFKTIGVQLSRTRKDTEALDRQNCI